jgi:hypothetical protein
MAHPLRRLGCVTLATVALSTTGCAGSSHLNEAGEQMSAALSDANRENDRHASACLAAGSTADMTAELTRHDDVMDDLMSRMDGACGQMRMGSMMSSRCSGTSFDDMSTALTDMHAEMAVHSSRMQTAASLEDAQTECATHTTTMRNMTRGMMDDLHNMSCMGE